MKFRIIEHENTCGVVYYIERMTREKRWFCKEKWDMIRPAGTSGYFSKLERAEAGLKTYIDGLDYPKIKVIKEIEIDNVKN